jgi:hypothetical protein
MGDLTGGGLDCNVLEPSAQRPTSSYYYTEYLLCTLQPALSSFCTCEPQKQLHLHYLLLPSSSQLITTNRGLSVSLTHAKDPLVCTQILGRGPL